jgi:hypothetical protein
MATLQQPVAGFPLDVAVDFSRKGVQERLTPAATRNFLKICDLWKLRDTDARQILGGVSNGSFYDLKAGKTKKLDQDRLTRASLVIGIFKALNILYSRKLADSWIQLPNTNPMFRGDTPLSYIIRGGMPALIKVRQLLDARRGGR